MANRNSARLTAHQGRVFALMLSGAFAVLSAVSWWQVYPRSCTVFAILTEALVLVGLLMPTRLGPLRDAWMGLAHAVSRARRPPS